MDKSATFITVRDPAPVTSRLVREIGPALALALCLMASSGAWARTLEVAVLPTRAYVPRVDPGQAVYSELLSERLRVDQWLREALTGYPDVRVLSPAQVQTRLANDVALDARARTALARYRLGLEYFMGLSPARAVASLREAASLYTEAFHDITAPKATGDAWFLLGVSLLDAGDLAGAHVALKRGFAVQPSRSFRKGLFSAQAEQALRTALVDFLSTGQLDRPYGEVERLRRVASKLGVDAIATVAISGKEKTLMFSLYRAGGRRLDVQMSAPLPEAATRVDAAISRWLACLPDTSPSAAPEAKSNVRLDTGGAYTMYLRQPTRRAFHSLGFSFGATRPIGPGLEWFVHVQMLTSLPDPYRDLLYTFNSLRAAGGLSFVITRRRYRLWIRPGIDLHALGNFVASFDPECKLFGESHPMCNAATVRDLEQDVLVGFYLAAGVDIELGRRFYVVLRASGSAYILPFSNTDDLNFPVSGDVGLGYRF